MFLKALLAAGVALPCLAQQSAVEAGRLLYREHCFVCHGPDGQSVAGVDFRAGFRRASTDEEISKIILGGIPGTGMPPTNLAEGPRRSLVAYLRSMHTGVSGSKGTGDAAEGRAIVEGKGGCLQCHRVGDEGSRMGPELSGIGAMRQAAYLEQALTDPNAAIAPQNRMVHAVTRSGEVIDGRRLNEDTHTVQLIDAKERLVSLSKSDLREYDVLKTSPMPSYKDRLSAGEIADVVSYLLSLKAQ